MVATTVYTCDICLEQKPINALRTLRIENLPVNKGGTMSENTFNHVCGQCITHVLDHITRRRNEYKIRQAEDNGGSTVPFRPREHK